MFPIEVVYATQDNQKLIVVELPEGCTVLDALRISNIIELCPDILIESRKTAFEDKSFSTELNSFGFELEKCLQEIKSDIHALEGRVGIFGKIVPLSAMVKPGDRIEIYHFLLQDPKQTRRLKAIKEIKKMKADHKALKRKNKVIHA